MKESRIKKYKRYKKRIEGYTKEMEMYRFAIENKGNIFWAKEIVDHFDYGHNLRFGGYPSILNSRLGKYISLLPHKRGEKRFLQVKDVIWIPQKTFTETINPRRLNLLDSSKTASLGFMWVEKSKVPFWLLADYGGPVSTDDYVNRLKESILDTKDEIKTLKLGEKWKQKR